jgi:hypothetical protein
MERHDIEPGKGGRHRAETKGALLISH